MERFHIFLPFISTAIAFLLFKIPAIEFLELKLYDTKFYIRDFVLERSPKLAVGEVSVIHIDERSFESIGVPLALWGPYFADFVSKCVSSGVKIVVFDFLLPQPKKEHLRVLAKSILEAKAEGTEIVLASEVLPTGMLKQPHPLLASVASGTAYYNLTVDADGFSRRLELYTYEKEIIPSLSFLISSLKLGLKPEELARQVPRVIHINFIPPEKFSIVEFVDALREPPRSEIVIMSPSPVIFRDFARIPYNSFFSVTEMLFSGAQVHAASVLNILNKEYLNPLSVKVVFILVLLFTLTLLINNRLNYTLSFIFTGVVLMLWFLFSLFMFLRGYILPVMPLFISAFINSLSGTLFRYYFLERKKRILESSFKKYVSEHLLDQIISHAGEVELGGKLHGLTVFVADIKGFTEMSERMGAMELVSFLNRIFEVLSAEVVKHGGFLVRYLGDAVFALFGVPLEKKDCGATEALKCAIDVFRKAREIDVRVDVALATGQAVVGNIGSQWRYDYTAIGDVVNTAFRIEGTAKDPDGSILISEDTKNLLEEPFDLVEVGEIPLKGKEKPVKIFRVL